MKETTRERERERGNLLSPRHRVVSGGGVEKPPTPVT